ncbi:retrovirus-related pol polyprotein from transposon TNT 1-94 [Tanacetum coccineum]
MSATVPPIPPPFGANTGNPSSPNRADNPTDTINNTTTTSVVQNIKDRFMVYLDGLEPYLLEILENGPFVPLSPFILISCLPNDVMKSIIKCIFVHAIWTDIILAHEGPSEAKDTKIAALRLKINAFKALEGERVNGTFTRLKSLLNDLETMLCMANTAMKKDSDSDIEEDQRSNNEFSANLNAEFHERSLLANQRRFYKRSGRVGSLKKPMDMSNETCFACGKLRHFQNDCSLIKISSPPYPSVSKSYNKPKFHTNSTPQHNQSVNNNQKDYKVKYKGLKAEIVVFINKIEAMNKGKSEKGLVAKSFDWDEELVSSDDEEVTTFKALIDIADEELLVGRVDASPGIPSDSESEGITQRPLPSLPKLIRAEPSGITKCLTISKTKQTIDKAVFANVKQKSKTKSPSD